MTAGERLVLLAGTGGSAAALLMLVSLAGSTAGDRLVSRSGLGTASAAAHLLADVMQPPVVAGGVSGWRFRPSIPFQAGDPLEEEEALLMAGAI